MSADYYVYIFKNTSLFRDAFTKVKAELIPIHDDAGNHIGDSVTDEFHALFCELYEMSAERFHVGAYSSLKAAITGDDKWVPDSVEAASKIFDEFNAVEITDDIVEKMVDAISLEGKAYITTVVASDRKVSLEDHTRSFFKFYANGDYVGVGLGE